MSRFCLFLAACFLCVSASASRNYQASNSAGGFTLYSSPSFAISQGCISELIKAGLPYTVVKVGGSDDWAAIALASGIATAVTGTSVSFTCQTYSGGTVYGTAVSHVVVVQTCPTIGTPTFAIMRTTIATWNPAADPAATSANAMPNPQCSNQCVVEHPTGVAGGAVCEGYVAPGVTPAVGVVEWVICQSHVGFVYTGASCNYTGADYLSMAETSTDMPADAVATQPNAVAATAVDVSATCLDADANGYDDDSGIACSVLAAAQLDAMTSAQKAQMEAIGTGSSIAGDVNTLAAVSGGIFAFPQALMNFLNPPSTCNFQFALNALPMLAALNLTVGWCDVKSSVEPFLAFGMWVITVFVSAGFFQKVD